MDNLVRSAHDLLRSLLALCVWIALILRIAFIIPLLLHLLTGSRLSRYGGISVKVVDEVLRVNCLGRVRGAPEDKASTVALPRESLNLSFDCLMDEMLAAAVRFLWRRKLLRVLLHVLLIELKGRSVSVYGLRSLLIRIGQAYWDVVAAD